jgi:hypothetical protein
MRYAFYAAGVVGLVLSLWTDLFAPVPGLLHFILVWSFALPLIPAFYIPVEIGRWAIAVVRREPFSLEFPVAFWLPLALVALWYVAGAAIAVYLVTALDITLPETPVLHPLAMANQFWQIYSTIAVVGVVIGVPIDLIVRRICRNRRANAKSLYQLVS